MPSVPPELQRQASTAILHDLVDAILAEDLFGFLKRGLAAAEFPETVTMSDFRLAAGERYFRVPFEGGADCLLLRVRGHCLLQPYRLSRPPVVLVAEQDRRELDAVELMRVLAERLPEQDAAWPNFESFLQDLEDAATQTALSLSTAKRRVREIVAPHSHLLAWEQFAALRDRPFHPTARTKSGWSADDYQAFSPEFTASFGLDWLAVRREFLQCSREAENVDVAARLLDADCRKQLETDFRQRGLTLEKYLAMPVHPWQMEHILPDLYADELAEGICVPIARNVGRFLATSSVRSLAPGRGGTTHVKLPLGISSLGALRLLPPRYSENGVRAQKTLQRLIDTNSSLSQRLVLCDERCWWAFSSGEEDLFADRPGHLGCLLREYPASLWDNASIQVIPMSALAVLTPEGRAPAAEAILHERHGSGAGADRVLSLFHEICERVAEVALLCFQSGVMPELHGQNVLLTLQAGRITGLLLRDHDTLRIHPAWMKEAGLPDPGYRIKTDTPNTLILETPEELLMYFQTLGIQVNLHAIAEAWAQAYSLDEVMFWRAIERNTRECLASFPLSGKVRDVWRYQLLEADTWPTKLVLTPLLRRVGAGGGSMPSGQGETGNPFRHLPAGLQQGEADG